ncbi:unnamed protein product [Discula destructiva]
MVLNAKILTASLLGTSALVADAAVLRRQCGSSNTSSDMVAASYFAGYHIDDNPGFTVEEIPWDKYSEIKYAFAETTATGSVDLSKSNPQSLPDFVKAAKTNNVKALVSVGGWTGSRFFSSSVGSAENRTVFIDALTKMVEQYNLDGLDFDWEYPNKQGLGCNAINTNDTANFLLFLQELRATPAGANLYLTAATSLFPWNDASGAQSTDLSGFAAVLDYLMPMNYDIFGGWSTTAGPNAPLRSSCDSTRNNQGSLEAGLAAWTGAGIPADKIVVGVPAYGHGFAVNTTSALLADGTLNMYAPQNSSNRFQGSSWDTDPRIDDCGNASPPSGTYPFWSLIEEMGFLTAEGLPAGNVTASWDECSATPGLYDSARQIYVSYDDARSFEAKGKFIAENGLKGFALFETGGDYNNILMNSIRAAVGLP